MLEIGKKVIVKRGLVPGSPIEVEGTSEIFYVPDVAETLEGKVVTITGSSRWVRRKDGSMVYYYRIKEDSTQYGWLEEFFEEAEIEDIVLISLCNGEHLVIKRSNVKNIAGYPKYSALSDEVKLKCRIF